MENQRVWAEIDLDKIAHNTKIVRNLVPQTAKLMASIKADAYGHGAVECAKLVLYSGADWLGVAIAEEGIDLRENNILEPILILGYTPKLKFMEVIKYDLIQTVFHKEMAEEISRAAVKLSKKAQIHIKIDTGMSRLGFMPNAEAVDEIMEISRLPGIGLTGVYTHFADSDSTTGTFTYEQFAKFGHVVAMLKAAGLRDFMVHSSNSAAICQYEHMAMDMARSGILLYGLSPSGEIDVKPLGFQPAMSFKSRISYIKRLAKNVSIGYGRSFYTQRESVVATVPLGYADGYTRVLSNKGRVLCCGEYAEIIGNICMDQFMIDVTDIKGAREGSEITLIGEQGGKVITADELAAIQSTINYEVVCAIGKRVPRAYIRNGEMIKMVNL